MSEWRRDSGIAADGSPSVEAAVLRTNRPSRRISPCAISVSVVIGCGTLDAALGGDVSFHDGTSFRGGTIIRRGSGNGGYIKSLVNNHTYEVPT